MSEFPTLQGQFMSWAEIQPSLSIFDGIDMQTRDFKAVEWDDSLTPAKIRGTGAIAIGRTFGEHDANASITMYYAKAVEFLSALSDASPNAPTGLGCFVTTFDLPISWTPLDGIGDVYSVRLVGCRILKRSQKNAPGTEGTALEMPLSIMRVAMLNRFGEEI